MIELVTTQAHTGMSSVHIKFGTTTLQSYITHKLPTTGNAYALMPSTEATSGGFF
ncbi:MAG TPA: hypothetical protein VHW01_01995 [Polyangiaceae bacterium]|nr:hypothetical protein [Polyangiaceae bacterium]